MELLLICLSAVNLIFAIIFIVKILRMPKPIGKIIITDEDSLYVELNDYDSMDKIHKSKTVIFEVWHEKQISPK